MSSSEETPLFLLILYLILGVSLFLSITFGVGLSMLLIFEMGISWNRNGVLSIFVFGLFGDLLIAGILSLITGFLILIIDCCPNSKSYQPVTV